MKNSGKVGNKPGQPKYRSSAEWRARKNLQVNNFKPFNQQVGRKSRPLKVFNRGK